MPRSLASPSFWPPGMIAPGSATATVWPAATLGAPQTIVRGSPPLPSSTVQTLQPVGVRVLLGGQDLADDEVRGVADAEAVDLLDLGGGQRQAVGELLGGPAAGRSTT